jgi:hypothetical protein
MRHSIRNVNLDSGVIVAIRGDSMSHLVEGDADIGAAS